MSGPSGLHPSIRRRRRRGRDAAFASYLYVGLALTAAFVLNRLPTSWWLYRAGSLVLSSPWVTTGFVVAVVLAVATSLVHWREPALPLLGALLAAATAVLIMVPSSPTVREHVAGPFFVLATLAWLVIPLRWFLRGRRRWSG
jgi:hypothetical protein